jgi:hypothetical protein
MRSLAGQLVKEFADRKVRKLILCCVLNLLQSETIFILSLGVEDQSLVHGVCILGHMLKGFFQVALC